MRILLAEDEADLNQLITRKLTLDSYSVDSCQNGSEDKRIHLGGGTDELHQLADVLDNMRR